MQQGLWESARSMAVGAAVIGQREEMKPPPPAQRVDRRRLAGDDRFRMHSAASAGSKPPEETFSWPSASAAWTAAVLRIEPQGLLEQ